MARPPSKATELKDGFYLEVRNKGSQSGIKIRRDNLEQLQHAIKQYEGIKEVIVIGEMKKGKRVDKS